MAKLNLSIASILGILFLFRIDSSLASTEDTHSAVIYAKTRDAKGSVSSDMNIMNGIFRGQASVTGVQGSEVHEISYNNGIGAPRDAKPVDQQLLQDKTSPEDDTNIFHGSLHGSCAEDTEYLLAAYEDIRLELSAIDQQYMENASIQDVCVRDGKIANCNFDFREYPSNLETVCQNRGGNFYRTEHSIQCHNPSTMDRLYYQFDHYPSCCSEVCEMTDANGLLKERIDSITELMAEFLQMSCFADSDILRHANDSSAILESSSGSTQRSSWQWLQIVSSAVPFLLILQHWN